MARPNIEAEVRIERGKNAARRVRMGHKVPGVLYGAGAETVALTLDPKRLLAALHSQAGHNTIFDLRLKDGDSSPAMIVETQFEPVRGVLLHVDLKRIAMDQMLKVSVPVLTAGESKGVKTQGGILEIVIREVEVECLPDDIPDHITVAVDNLMLGESIRLSDLQQGLGDKVKLTGDLTAVICHVVTPKAEEAAPAVEAAVAGAAEPEVIKKGKATEEGAEGAEKGDKGDKKK